MREAPGPYGGCRVLVGDGRPQGLLDLLAHRRADRARGQGRRPADEVGQHLLTLPAQGPHLRARTDALRLPHPHPELHQPPDRVRRLPGQAVDDPGGGGGPPQRVDGRGQVLVPVRAGLPGQLVPAGGEALRRRAVQLVEDAVEIHRAIVPPVTSGNGVPRRAAGTAAPAGPHTDRRGPWQT